MECRNLGKSYETFQALTGVSLRLDEHEFLSILGPSGCGKSTLLRLIAGLEVPSQGEVFLYGQEISGRKIILPPESRKFGMIFQDFALFPHLSVNDNVEYGATGSKKEKQLRVLELLELVSLSHLATKMPHQISGGEQQRIALARALAPRPCLMLMDEPFSNLDEASKTRVRDDMYRAVQRARITALWVSHDIKQIMSVVKHVTLIKSGRLQQAGEPEQLYREPCNRYVAGFFGKVNILPVHLVNQGLDHPIAEATAGEMGASREIPEVVIRPDHIDLVEEAEASIVGVVKHTFFQGEKREVVVCAGEHEITVNVGRERIVSVGERLFLRPKCSELRLIRALSHKVR